jgi:hypothetical protein
LPRQVARRWPSGPLGADRGPISNDLTVMFCLMSHQRDASGVKQKGRITNARGTPRRQAGVHAELRRSCFVVRLTLPFIALVAGRTATMLRLSAARRKATSASKCHANQITAKVLAYYICVASKRGGAGDARQIATGGL